jgi:glutathione synthase/RimK-type ligase-like ATP-grasp enzyme
VARTFEQQGRAATMKRIRFGSHAGFSEHARQFLDTEAFSVEFGVLSEIDYLRYDAVVPLEFYDYRILEQAPDFNGVKFLMPTAAVEKLCADKLLFNRWMVEAGHGEFVPQIFSGSAPTFPYIIKNRIDQDGVDSHVVMDRDSEKAMTAHLDGDKYYKQEYIIGDLEFALHALLVDGEPRYHQLVEYKMGVDIYVKGQQASALHLEMRSGEYYMEKFAPILQRLGYTGACCIDFKIQGGQPKIFEINPRPGYTLMRDINRYLVAYLSCLRRR